MLLQEAKFSYIREGMKIRSLWTDNIGVIHKVTKSDPNAGFFNTIDIRWYESGLISRSVICEYNKSLEILNEENINV